LLLLLPLAGSVAAGVHVVASTFPGLHHAAGHQIALAVASSFGAAGRPYHQLAPPPTPILVEGQTEDDWATIFRDDFEGDFPGDWDVGDVRIGPGEYHWGQRDCRAYEGSFSAWAVGAGQDGALLACGSEYPDLVYSYMTYGPFSLEDASAAELTFRLWLSSQPDLDTVFWGFSTDGQHFRDGSPLGGTSDGWVEHSLDLMEALGETNVWITFIFFSDEEVRLAEGAYVDDVVLRMQHREFRVDLPIVLKESGLVVGLLP
jgi:hypothetical protein